MSNGPARFPDWKTLYEQTEASTLPWFYQELDPDLEEALKRHHLRQGAFLDLGTGPGTQAVALARLGFDVTGSDLSQAAIEQAASLSEKVRFVQDDILNTQLQPGFDFILDRGCFHVLPPETRARYVETVHRLLNPGGYLFLKVFSTAEREYAVGPYRFSHQDIPATFGSRFQLLSIKDTLYQGTLEEKPKALFAVLRKQLSPGG